MTYEDVSRRIWVRRYAWLPRRMTHGYWIWLEAFWELMEQTEEGHYESTYRHNNS